MGMSSGDNRSLPCGIVSSIHMGGGGDIQLSLECPEFIFKNFYWEREGTKVRSLVLTEDWVFAAFCSIVQARIHVRQI